MEVRHEVRLVCSHNYLHSRLRDLARYEVRLMPAPTPEALAELKSRIANVHAIDCRCSRLGAHHSLNPWSLEEVQEYLKKGLEAVGIHRSRVFEPAAVDLLVRATAGVPRSVCLLARAAWLEAARAGVQEISAQLMQPALEQVPGLAGLTRTSAGA